MYKSLFTGVQLSFKLALIGWILSSCQTNSSKNPTPDSHLKTKNKDSIEILTLSDFKLNHVVVYRLNGVTIVIKQNEFKKKLQSLWEEYHAGMSTISTDDDKGFVADYTARFKVLDSALRLFQNPTSNIIYLHHAYFAQVKFAPLIDFGNYIDNGDCAIFDKNNKRQFRILRKLYSWYEGPRSAEGGRRYFFLKDSHFFYEEMDWIS